MRSVGVVGLGTVGGTVAEAFMRAEVPCVGYDRYLEEGKPSDLGRCHVVFVCVPTPPGEGGALDVTAVWSAVGEVAVHLGEKTIVVVNLTVPPGTSDALATEFPRLRFAHIPEFLVASDPMATFIDPDRVVIGAHSPDVAAELKALLSIVVPFAPMVTMTPSEAELVKLCSNVMLAAKVAVANELAMICERYGVAWSGVQAGVGMDRRLGPAHLTVTVEGGFGGGCFPKDLDGLIASARAGGYEPSILAEIAAFNRRVRRAPSSERETVAGANT